MWGQIVALDKAKKHGHSESVKGGIEDRTLGEQKGKVQAEKPLEGYNLLLFVPFPFLPHFPPSVGLGGG